MSECRAGRKIFRAASGILSAPRAITSAEGFVTQDGNVRMMRLWSLVPLRVIVGYGFVVHGYAKIMNGPERFAASLHGLGVPAPHAMSWITIVCELLGGLAVLAGAYIPLVSVPLAAILIFAGVSVHLPYGFSSIKLRAVTPNGPEFGPPGYETNLLYLAALIALAHGSRLKARGSRDQSDAD
jgi:putative oxidoreductase